MKIVIIGLMLVILTGCVRVPQQNTAAPGVRFTHVAQQLQRIDDADNTCYLFVGDNHRSALSCVKKPAE